jgi:hypothetical protein
VSIIPGIETAAPERTDTSRGSSSDPNCSHVLVDLFGEAGGQVPLPQVRAAGVSGDREALRDGDAHLRHLREADALPAEELAPTGRRLVEAVDVAIGHPRGNLDDWFPGRVDAGSVCSKQRD